MSYQTRFPDSHPSHQPPRNPTSQFPPSQDGYHWTCNLCNSVFGTREQTEQHQFHCPVRTGQSQLFRTHPTGGGHAPQQYSGAYDGRSQQSFQPRSMQPYSTAVYSQRPTQHGPTHTTAAHLQHPVPPQTKHGVQERQTVLIWVNQASTSEREVTYIDNLEGVMVLLWNQNSESFQCESKLSLGQHSGCLSLGLRDSVLPINPFLVEAGDSGPQKILISIEQKQNPKLPPQRRNVTHSDLMRTDGSGAQRDKPDQDRVRELEATLNKLSADLEERNSELMKRREKGDKLSLDLAQTVEENKGLRREVDELRRDNSVLKKRLEETETGLKGEENLRAQIRELENKQKRLLKENEGLKVDKNLLCGQKEGVEGELEGVRARLKPAQKEGLKETEKDGNGAGRETGFQVQENLRMQIRELESEKEGLYKENEKLKRDKVVANDYSDLLRSQKQEVKRELEQERASLFSAQKENGELSQKLSMQPKGEDATPPPIPSRSKPLPRETQASKQPPDGELYSLEFNAELNSEVKAVSHEGKELRLRPITNLLDAEKHKGHRVVCECEDANRTPRYLEGVLECLFGDEGTTIAGVRFPTEVVGMSNGVYKEKKWFDAPEGKGGFFPNNSVYIST